MADAKDENFDADLIRKYPKANRKITLEVMEFGLMGRDADDVRSQTTFISPYGMEFQGKVDFEEGTLLKIRIALPNFWGRKQQLVDYGRVDHPDTFKILAKVVRCEDVGKRGRKKKVLVQTVNIDNVDEQVLKKYLQEG